MRGLGIDGDALQDELLKRLKVFNYIPEGREGDHRTAILETYELYRKKNEKNGR